MRYAETEALSGQPYEDHRRVRVSGPFTGETLPQFALSREAAGPGCAPRFGRSLRLASLFHTRPLDKLAHLYYITRYGVW